MYFYDIIKQIHLLARGNLRNAIISEAYDIMSAKEKQATAKQAFVFAAVMNEQTPDEIGQEARQRGFASLYDIIA